MRKYIMLFSAIIVFLSCNKEEKPQTNILGVNYPETVESSKYYPQISVDNTDNNRNYLTVGYFSTGHFPEDMDYLFVYEKDNPKVIMYYFSGNQLRYAYYFDKSAKQKADLLVEFSTDNDGIIYENIYSYDWGRNYGTLVQTVKISKQGSVYVYEIIDGKKKNINFTRKKNNLHSKSYSNFADLLEEYLNTPVFQALSWLNEHDLIDEIWNDLPSEYSIAEINLEAANFRDYMIKAVNDGKILNAPESRFKTLNDVLNEMLVANYDILGLNELSISITSYFTYLGETYKILKIGNQIWLGENLRASKDREGNDIECYDFSDNPSYSATYGKLYKWDAAQKVCPPGWHLPSDEEWDELINFVGGYPTAGTYLKPGGVTKFNAMLAGYRDENGKYKEQSYYVGYWTNQSDNTDKGVAISFYLNYTYALKSSYSKEIALSVRCIKD